MPCFPSSTPLSRQLQPYSVCVHQIRPDNISDSGSGLGIQSPSFSPSVSGAGDSFQRPNVIRTATTALPQGEMLDPAIQRRSLRCVLAGSPRLGVVDLVAINRSLRRSGQHRAGGDTPARLLATSPVGHHAHKNELHQQDRENCPAAINLSTRQSLLYQTSTGRASKNGQAAGSVIESWPPRLSCPSAAGD